MRLIDILWYNRIQDVKEVTIMFSDCWALFKELKKSFNKKRDEFIEKLK